MEVPHKVSTALSDMDVENQSTIYTSNYLRRWRLDALVALDGVVAKRVCLGLVYWQLSWMEDG